MQPLILTLRFEDVAQAMFERLRQAHFPPARNVIPAHLTLFHHLPGELEAAIFRELAAVAAAETTMTIEVVGLRSLGRGVAFELRSERLAKLRRRLADAWAANLTAQDRQGFRPHVTVQNKVDPAEARRLLGELQASFAPFTVEGRGLDLWRYLGGPWEHRATFGFGDPLFDAG